MDGENGEHRNCVYTQNPFGKSGDTHMYVHVQIHIYTYNYRVIQQKISCYLAFMAIIPTQFQYIITIETY